MPHALLPNLGLPGLALGTFVSALALTAALVAVTIRICRRQGWVARPRPDRWHRGTPCLFGGVPLWIGFLALSAVLLPAGNHLVWKLIAISSLMFFLGLADDIFHLRPRTKFLVQLLAAALLLGCGVLYPLQENLLLNVALTLFWIAGITNAFNLLDNMDGLSAGVALVSALYLGAFYIHHRLPDYTLLAAIFAGAVAGFLLFNRPPARIFMGDAGSLFVGFTLASASLLQVTHVSGVPTLVFAPLLVLGIPIFDTFFVTVTRRLQGRPISQGGTDHSSHRLVRLGLREQSAVLLLCLLSAASGALALALHRVHYPHALGLVAFWFLFLLIFGIHLYQPEAVLHPHAPPAQLTLLQRLHNRDTLALLLDPLLLSLSYYAAYFLRFGTEVPHGDMVLFFKSWPIVLTLKFVCLWWRKVYQRSWWRGSSSDAYRLALTTALGETLAVLVVMGLYRFSGYSRTVFLLDAVFSWVLLLGLRRSFPVFRDFLDAFRPHDPSQRSVFVVGTSEGAAGALHFLRDHGVRCMGLIDTNGGSDLGRCVWGTPVVGALPDLGRLAHRHRVFEVVLPESEPVPCSEAEFSGLCRRHNLRLLKLGLYPADRPSRRD